MFSKNALQYAQADGAQRSRFVGLMPLTLCAFALVSTPAAAEVCDKLVGESWRPDQGPVWLLNPYFPQLIVWTIVATGVAAAVLLERKWPSYLAAVCSVLVVGLTLLEPPPGDPAWEASLREGCASTITMTLDAAIVVTLAAACILLGHSVSRRRMAS